MKRKFSYSMKEMNYRLLMMGRPIWKYIGISTLASTLGALSHMGLMGFGALCLLAAAGFCDGAGIYAALTAVCAVLIAVCRYLEGVFSHLGAYGILAKMRVHLFNAIDRIAPAYLIGRETGDVMNIAVSDIETLEYFFAHTIGPMFTVILLPTTTVVIAWGHLTVGDEAHRHLRVRLELPHTAPLERGTVFRCKGFTGDHAVVQVVLPLGRQPQPLKFCLQLLTLEHGIDHRSLLLRPDIADGVIVENKAVLLIYGQPGHCHHLLV